MESLLRILLADDHVLFRRGLADLLNQRADMVVVGEACSGTEAIALARETNPDIILMDVQMPNGDGLEATRIILQQMPEISIVMLTVSDDDDFVFQALRNGAKGYLLKDLDPLQLFAMLKAVHQGEAAVSRAMAAKILQRFQEGEVQNTNGRDCKNELTAREITVLEQVVTGATNKDIAEALSISQNTVKIHLRNIFGKFQVQNRVQLAVHAVREGLLENDSGPEQDVYKYISIIQ